MSADAKAGPVLPEVSMHLHTPASPAEAVVVSNERCTAGRKPAGFVRHVVLDVSGTQIAGKFRAGQSFGVIPPGVDAAGKPHKVRLYSIASPTRGEDGHGAHLATTVKRLIDEHDETGKLFLGVASNYLCDLKPGDRVKVSGPNGKRFVLPATPTQHRYLFVATGTGIAPFRGMLGDLAAMGGLARGSVSLVMGSPYASDLLYDSELRSTAASSGGWFAYHTALSRERQESGGVQRAMYVQDRIEAEESIRELLRDDRTLIYMCGIAGMELGVFQALARLMPGGDLDGYLEVDPDVRGEVGGWTRRMIHKQVRPTRRVFLEVY